jgi:hypothetical protein
MPLSPSLPRQALFVSMLLYGAALLTKVFPGVLGAMALAYGWLEALYARREVGVLVAFAWFANPLLFATWLLVQRRAWRRALATGVLTLLLALGCLFGTHIVVSGSGAPQPMPALGLGYWLWIASGAVALAGALAGWLGAPAAAAATSAPTPDVRAG